MTAPAVYVIVVAVYVIVVAVYVTVVAVYVTIVAVYVTVVGNTYSGAYAARNYDTYKHQTYGFTSSAE